MESIFKKHLTQSIDLSKPQTFEDAILGTTFWYESEVVLSPSKENLSEKSVVLDSLKNFAQEKISSSPTGEFVFSGGILKTKENQILWEPKFGSADDFFKHFIQQLPTPLKSFYGQKFLIAENIRSIVWTESLIKDQLDSSFEDLPPSFNFYFEKEVAHLLFKMMGALKLDVDQYCLLSTAEWERDLILELIYWVRPDVIVPLGAGPTKKILHINDKLSLIHGKKHLLPLGNLSLPAIPLFHPSILVGNQNMKKTTWSDMQEIISILHS